MIKHSNELIKINFKYSGEIVLKRNRIIQVKKLRTSFNTEEGICNAVNGVSFDVYQGDTLGIVGESGSGKSVTALSIMRLINYTNGKIIKGEILFNGIDLVKKNQSEMRKIRGNDLAMIFQEPMTSLNPVFTIGEQISEAILLHKNVTKKIAIEQTIEILKKVEISLPEKRIYEYPHQLSGGMKQRVMIAMALSCNPKLLIADEPTTALDVTIQAQILSLINNLKQKNEMSMIMITHDLGIVAEVSNQVAVMYAGNIVEYADVKSLFANPKHPYTVGLMSCIPRLNFGTKRLQVIPGNVPNLIGGFKGCSYNNRCTWVKDICLEEEPPMYSLENNHLVKCWRYSDSIEQEK